VAFRAFLSEDVRTRSQRPLIFKEVEINIGNSYSPQTGYFVAPMAGLYAFSVSVGPKDPIKPAEAALMMAKDNLLFHVGSADEDSPNSSQTVHHMKAGDNVWVETYPGESSFERGGSSFFFGFLVHPD
jgi:hypothetical protein